jgi:amino acid efflux transporter
VAALASTAAGPAAALVLAALTRQLQLRLSFRAQIPKMPDRRPTIGTHGLVVFYVTNLVGAGILVAPALAERIAGPASFVSWAVLVLVSFPIARLFAETSARRPSCGGISAMIRIGLGTIAGKTASMLLVVAFVLFNPVMGIASARYACDLLGLNPTWTMPLAALCMLLSVAFCFARLGTAAKVQGAVLATLLATTAVAIALLVPSMSTARLEPLAPHGWLAVGSALPVVFLSFIGWETASGIAEEVRDARRSFRRAIRIAVPVVGIIYLTVVAAFLAAPHSGTSLVMPTLLGAGAGAGAGVGEDARALADVLALLVVWLCTNSLVLCGSRFVLAAARDGLLPPTLATRSERTGAPTAALLALAGAYVLMIAIIAILGLNETDVVTLTTAIFMFLYLATAASVLRDRPDRGTRASALLTAAAALCLLPFTGSAALAAGAMTIAVAIAVKSQRYGRLRAPRATPASPYRPRGLPALVINVTGGLSADEPLAGRPEA